VVSEHGSPLRVDTQCVDHACILVACVSLVLSFHVLVAFA